MGCRSRCTYGLALSAGFAVASATVSAQVASVASPKARAHKTEAAASSVLANGVVKQAPITNVTREMTLDVTSGTPQLDATATLDFAAPTTPKTESGVPRMLYNTTDGKAPNGQNDNGLRSDCQPAGNCQAGAFTTAYNTTQYAVAEDFVVTASGTINSSCIQGIFWDFASSNCSDGGTEDWTINIYDDAGGFPGTVIATYTGCTDAGCVPGAGDITMVKDTPTGAPTFAGYPVFRINADFTTGGNAGFAVTAGQCYYSEWLVALGANPCGFFWQAGAAGNLRAMQDAAFDGYDCCESLSEDMSICVDLPLDNTAILGCDQCALFPPANDSCIDASSFPLTPGVPEAVDTSGGGAGDDDIPDPPGLEGYDMSSNEGVWYSYTPAADEQIQLDFTSTNMDTVLAVYCGSTNCDKFYAVAGNDDPAVGTDAQIIMDVTGGTEYQIYCTSVFKCGTGTLLLTQLGPDTGNLPNCGPCALQGFISGTVTADEATFEPCDDTGATRLDDGCNATGVTSDFFQLVDGDIVSGTSWALAGTRDTDWYYITNTNATDMILVWQTECRFPNNNFQIDVGGDILTPDCVNLTIPRSTQADRCGLNTTIQTIPGSYDEVLWVGPTEFDFLRCNGLDGVPNSGDEDNQYMAAVSMITPCVLANGAGDDECGATDTNSGCNGASDADFEAISLGTDVFGDLNAAGNSRDTDWYVLSALGSGDYEISLQSEVPTVVFAQDHGTALFANCATATTLGAWGVLPCAQVTLPFTAPTAGNNIVLFFATGNLDGSGIFSGYPCPPAFPPGQDDENEYIFRVDSVGGGDCLGGFGGCYDTCQNTDQNTCESNCGIYMGDGVSCPAVVCIADQTTTGAPAGDPLYGIPDGSCTAADIQFYVNLYTIQDCRADVTTAGAAVGNPGYGVQDGSVTAADIQFVVNAYTDCQATGGTSCNPGGPCTP